MKCYNSFPMKLHHIMVSRPRIENDLKYYWVCLLLIRHHVEEAGWHTTPQSFALPWKPQFLWATDDEPRTLPDQLEYVQQFAVQAVLWQEKEFHDLHRYVKESHRAPLSNMMVKKEDKLQIKSVDWISRAEAITARGQRTSHEYKQIICIKLDIFIYN